MSLITRMPDHFKRTKGVKPNSSHGRELLLEHAHRTHGRILRVQGQTRILILQCKGGSYGVRGNGKRQWMPVRNAMVHAHGNASRGAEV
jgi:hypothetical protein